MEASDAALVALARAGDGNAFRLLVDRHGRKLFRLAFRLTGSEEDAEDVVQEAFLRAYRSLDGFDERAQFSSWLYRIASNQAFDLLRARKYRVAQSLSEPALDDRMTSHDPGPDRLALSAQLKDRIGVALDELTPQERMAFTLRHFEGHSIEEIGERLAVSANATRNAVFRAVQKVRRALQSAAGEEAAWRS